ncbi:MAG: 16S rRNA (guanine(527)-N(7))-methyltransferase RsmG [Burkholderiales bacterium]|jgi:16S rRNA (guanine527-N7)-methyltransferase|nr:16S rRNA (guanine(527)-N(7))-methyltransferase RsmG [Burkholderiales bacterium]
MGLDAEQLARAAQPLGLNLSAAQCDALLRHAALLAKWNRTHNLTAIGRDADVLTHHLLDSLSIVPVIAPLIAAPGLPAPVRLLDVGSGGGLPAVPLAIACPALQVTALDKVQKKVAFLTQAKVELRLDNFSAVAARVEAWQAPAPFALIVSRAFASLADFVALTRHLLAREGRWLAMKGHRPGAELAALPADIAVIEVRPLRVPGLGEERHLIELKRRSET